MVHTAGILLMLCWVYGWWDIAPAVCQDQELTVRHDVVIITLTRSYCMDERRLDVMGQDLWDRMHHRLTVIINSLSAEGRNQQLAIELCSFQRPYTFPIPTISIFSFWPDIVDITR